MMAEACFNEAGEVQALGPVGWKGESWRTGSRRGSFDPLFSVFLPHLYLQLLASQPCRMEIVIF